MVRTLTCCCLCGWYMALVHALVWLWVVHGPVCVGGTWPWPLGGTWPWYEHEYRHFIGEFGSITCFSVPTSAYRLAIARPRYQIHCMHPCRVSAGRFCELWESGPLRTQRCAPKTTQLEAPWHLQPSISFDRRLNAYTTRDEGLDSFRRSGR